MIEPFDIFQLEETGAVRWIRAMTELELAKAHVKQLAAEKPADYIILSQRSGTTVVMRQQS